uniref:Putative secreted protein n=1 Tax=Panstrongylus lignarius TaxID=156445 RepID=A0A224Y2W5_9HEMI
MFLLLQTKFPCCCALLSGLASSTGRAPSGSILSGTRTPSLGTPGKGSAPQNRVVAPICTGTHSKTLLCRESSARKSLDSRPRRR